LISSHGLNRITQLRKTVTGTSLSTDRGCTYPTCITSSNSLY
jgi:hypothetical protein